jgi:cytochrome P450
MICDNPVELPSFITMDGPRHLDQRKAVAPMFTPSHLSTPKGLIRERAGNVLDAPFPCISHSTLSIGCRSS